MAAEAGPTRARRSCLTNQLRKTKICMYHVKGSCHFDTDCAFAHTYTELQATPNLRKTRLCRVFEMGHCEAVDCDFAHGEEELRSTNLFYKRTLCIWNEKGKCRNGDQCRFAHGSSELRVVQHPGPMQGALGGPAAAGAMPAGPSLAQPQGAPGRGAAVAVPPPPAPHGGGRRLVKACSAPVAAQLAQAAAAATGAGGAATRRSHEPMKVALKTWENPAATLGLHSAAAGGDLQQQSLTPPDSQLSFDNGLNLKADLERLREHLSALTLKCGQLWQLQAPAGRSGAASALDFPRAAWPSSAELPPGLDSVLPGGLNQLMAEPLHMIWGA